MSIIIVILLIFIFIFFYFYHYNEINPNSNINKEKFNSGCWTFDDDYNSCYSNSNCTIGFLPDGSTQCMDKFIKEDV